MHDINSLSQQFTAPAKESCAFEQLHGFYLFITKNLFTLKKTNKKPILLLKKTIALIKTLWPKTCKLHDYAIFNLPANIIRPNPNKTSEVGSGTLTPESGAFAPTDIVDAITRNERNTLGSSS
jgi:hypothetical protein